MSDSESRTLVILKENGSTARFLNLLRFYLDDAQPPPPNGLFQNHLLKRCIVAKHFFRGDEVGMFSDGRRHGTKIILPLNAQDLRLGGRYFLLGQNQYSDIRREIWGDSHDARNHDEAVLAILDKAPSLDPFLLRETFNRQGIQPDPFYFDLSEHDLQEMFDFARAELEPLAETLFGSSPGGGESGRRLVHRLLFNDESDQIEPLRLALRLEKDNYAEGMFAWKGFIYFKWQFAGLAETAPGVIRQIGEVFPTGQVEPEEKQHIRDMSRAWRAA